MFQRSFKTLNRSQTPSDIKRVEDIPLVAINLRIWKFCSLIIDHQPWRRFWIMAPTIILNVTQFLQLYYSTESVDVKIRNGFVAMLIFNSNLRAISLCVKRKQFEKFLEFLRTLYVEVLEMEDLEIQIMIERYTKKAQKLTKINLIVGSLVGVGMILYPFFVSERVLPFSVYVPFMDIYQSPWYEILFFFHSILTPNGFCMFIPFTIVVVSCILFAILMCRVLQHKLRNLATMAKSEVHREVVWCIRYQLTLIRFIDIINSLTSLLFLGEYLLFGSMLCAILFSMMIVNTIMEKIIICVYLLMIFTQSSLLYYYANELYEESLEVATAAYDVNWFDYDIPTQKTLQLLLLRSQKPCAILIGDIYPMNLRRLQSLYNVTYSFYTLLKTLYD